MILGVLNFFMNTRCSETRTVNISEDNVLLMFCAFSCQYFVEF